jgi:hypothetical protein
VVLVVVMMVVVMMIYLHDNLGLRSERCHAAKKDESEQDLLHDFSTCTSDSSGLHRLRLSNTSHLWAITPALLSRLRHECTGPSDTLWTGGHWLQVPCGGKGLSLRSKLVFELMWIDRHWR